MKEKGNAHNDPFCWCARTLSTCSSRHPTSPSAFELPSVSPDIVKPNISLCEVGPRDGFQFESVPISPDLKIEAIQGLIDAGLPRIQITSFVHPGRVPQMADAEDIVAAFSNVADVTCTGLALNERGVERAAASGLGYVDLSIATNEQHGRDNANMSVEEGVTRAGAMIEQAVQAGMQVQLGLQTVWGYKKPADSDLDTVRSLAARFASLPLESFSLADSTGLANPTSIKAVIEAVRSETDHPIVLHLHDTRGLGIANILAAIEVGVDRFDVSLGGMGGCPFIPGATGNVASEDVVWALEQSGYNTGVDIARVSKVSRQIAEHVGHPLSGKLYTLDNGVDQPS